MQGSASSTIGALADPPANSLWDFPRSLVSSSSPYSPLRSPSPSAWAQPILCTIVHSQLLIFAHATDPKIRSRTGLTSASPQWVCLGLPETWGAVAFSPSPLGLNMLVKRNCHNERCVLRCFWREDNQMLLNDIGHWNWNMNGCTTPHSIFGSKSVWRSTS